MAETSYLTEWTGSDIAYLRRAEIRGQALIAYIELGEIWAVFVKSWTCLNPSGFRPKVTLLMYLIRLHRSLTS